MSADTKSATDAIARAQIEHYLGHRNGGDMPSLIAYQQLKVLEEIRDLLGRALLDDGEDYDDGPRDEDGPLDPFAGPAGG